MDRLEQSINTLKNLFIERQTTIEVSNVYLQLRKLYPMICRSWLRPRVSERCNQDTATALQ